MITKQIAYIRSYAKSLPHKPGVDPNDWDRVDSNLILLLDCYVDFATSHDLPIMITSIKRPRIKGVSKSDTHGEGRAFDVSIHGWTLALVKSLQVITNERFKVGAISYSDHVEREAVYEDGKTAGTAPHLHFQVRRGLKPVVVC